MASFGSSAPCHECFNGEGFVDRHYFNRNTRQESSRSCAPAAPARASMTTPSPTRVAADIATGSDSNRRLSSSPPGS